MQVDGWGFWVNTGSSHGGFSKFSRVNEKEELKIGFSSGIIGFLRSGAGVICVGVVVDLVGLVVFVPWVVCVCGDWILCHGFDFKV